VIVAFYEQMVCWVKWDLELSYSPISPVDFVGKVSFTKFAHFLKRRL
jgi:hypothetical protein